MHACIIQVAKAFRVGLSSFLLQVSQRFARKGNTQVLERDSVQV